MKHSSLFSMPRIVAAGMMTLLALGAQGQSLNVYTGQVCTAVTASADEMSYSSDGTIVTIANKEFAVADIDSIVIDNNAVTDNTVNVTYNGTTANVVVAGNVAQYLTATVSDANVTLIQSDDLPSEITYNLSGTSTNGSFYMDGSLKATVALTDLTRTSTETAPIDIENGKRSNMVLSGDNTLSDATSSSSDTKGALMINGHSEFSGDGTLTISGYKKHGIWADEYLMTKKSFSGSIIVVYAAKDGMNINQYLEHRGGTITVSGSLDDGIQVGATGDEGDENDGQILLNGGTLNVSVTGEDVKAVKCDSMMTISDDYATPNINITISSASTASKGLKSGGDMLISAGNIVITTAGGAMWDSEDASTTASACIKTDGNCYIQGGTLTLTATGSGGKGINGDNALDISGGSITVKTSGGLFYSNGTTSNSNYTGDTDNISSDYTSSPKGIKTDGAISISGGETIITTTGYNGEGMESKSTMDISGGIVMATSSRDDAINSSGNMTISGGYVYGVSTGNDGIDANGNLYIQGGVVYAAGTSSPEVAIDANTEDGYQLYITGGTVITFGGIESGASVSTANISTTGASNTQYALTDGSSVIAAWKSPSSNYSSMAVYSSALTSGTSYTLYKGCTVSGTSYFNGYYTEDATCSGGTTSTVSATTGSTMGGTTPGTGGTTPGTGGSTPGSGGSTPGSGGGMSGGGRG